MSFPAPFKQTRWGYINIKVLLWGIKGICVRLNQFLKKEKKKCLLHEYKSECRDGEYAVLTNWGNYSNIPFNKPTTQKPSCTRPLWLENIHIHGFCQKFLHWWLRHSKWSTPTLSFKHIILPQLWCGSPSLLDLLNNQEHAGHIHLIICVWLTIATGKRSVQIIHILCDPLFLFRSSSKNTTYSDDRFLILEVFEHFQHLYWVVFYRGLFDHSNSGEHTCINTNVQWLSLTILLQLLLWWAPSSSQRTLTDGTNRSSKYLPINSVVNMLVKVWFIQ